MSTNRKTSLYLVCFYTLFIFSCINANSNKVTFYNQSSENQVEVSVLARSETTVQIQLTCISTSKNIHLRNANMVCVNVNPMSLNTMEASKDESLTQVYDGEYNGNKVRIILPYANLKNTKHHVVLRIVAANKATLEVKLEKGKAVKHEA